MSTNRAALATTTVALSDGTHGHIVGHIAAFPHHPAPGTIAEAIPGSDEPITGDSTEPLFALVSVLWATEVTTATIDETGQVVYSTTAFRSGMCGMPTGTSWYLAPVEATPAGFAILGRRAAGTTTAQIPAIDGITEAREVKVHDFPT